MNRHLRFGYKCNTLLANSGPLISGMITSVINRSISPRWDSPGYKLIQTQSIKEQAHQLLDNLPDRATWEYVMHRIYVRQAIEVGVKDSNEGRTIDAKEVRKGFGLPA